MKKTEGWGGVFGGMSVLVSYNRMKKGLYFSYSLEHSLAVTANSQPMVYRRSSQTSDYGYFDPYVEFNAELTDRPVLFMLPPGEGGAESYFNNIVKQLTDYRVVAFNNYYLHHNLPELSFEQLASYYLDFVRTIQPHGPYHFIGWSFGGVLSLEMSNQLVEAGETIAYLQSIDSYFNVKNASSDIYLPDDKDIIDKINYGYTPDQAAMERLVDATDTLVLFKAMSMNDTYSNDRQQRLYRYYQQSLFNNLDTLIDSKRITLIKMINDSHVSWVENKGLLASMGNFIANKIP